MTALLNIKNAIMLIVVAMIIALVMYVSYLRDTNEILTNQLSTAESTIEALKQDAIKSAKAQSVIVKHDSKVQTKRAKAKAKVAKQDDAVLSDVIRDALREISEE